MIIMDKLTSSLEERHVKTSPLPENGWDLMVEEASSREAFEKMEKTDE